MRATIGLSLTALLMVGCGSMTTGEKFRKPSPDGKAEIVLVAEESKENGFAAYKLYLVPAKSKIDGEPLSRITFRSLQNVPALPVVTWRTDTRIDVTITPDHSHFLPPSATIKLGTEDRKIDIITVVKTPNESKL